MGGILCQSIKNNLKEEILVDYTNKKQEPTLGYQYQPISLEGWQVKGTL